MTLYIPTITTPFEPNCLHPKAPFEFLDDHTKETHAIGIDIGRNSTATPTTQSKSNEDPIKINSDIHTYCIMSQVGVAAGLIVMRIPTHPQITRAPQWELKQQPQQQQKPAVSLPCLYYRHQEAIRNNRNDQTTTGYVLTLRGLFSSKDG
ncbi:hypothetical protein AA313_de0207825 [Arthrobotrys entomopaga]|nr:hypothetical protein AA313_de0207825 [Arthrobotrys entomopaga]